LLLAAPSINLAVPDVGDMIRQSVAANQRNLATAADFDHRERVLSHDGTRTYTVTMMLGTPYRRLTAINDQQLSDDERQREQQKQDAARAERERETPDERARRLDKNEKDRRRNRQLLDQLPQAFDFALEGEQRVGNFDAYVLRATPRRDFQPSSLEATVLTGMEGRFWLERQSFQWIKVEAAVTRPVTIQSFLAKMEPGTQFTLEQQPAAPGVWLPARFTMRTRGRILLLFKQRTQIDTTFFDYQRAERLAHSP
jgi:hypothetical protein